MAQAGTLDVGVGVDPTGLVRGFGRTKQEIQKFERSLTSSTRTMGGAFRNMAVDFAIAGDVGERGIKRLAESGIGLAGVFGPAGMITAAIGATALTLWNFHTRARDEAQKTADEYKKLATTFQLAPLVEALAAFDVDPDRGGKLKRWTEQLEDAQARVNRASAGGFVAKGALQDVEAITAKMAKLVADREMLVRLVTQQTQSAKALADAEAIVDARATSRLTTERALTQEAERQARFLEEQMRSAFAIVEANTANRVKVEQMAGAAVTGAMPGIDLGDPLAVAAQEARAFADALMQAAQAAKAHRDALISSVRGGVGGALSGMGGIGTHLGALVSGGLTGLLGSVAGSVVSGLGKLFGFGRKRGPSPEELAAKRLHELAKAARSVTEALRNIPSGFKVAQFLNAAATGVPVLPPPPGGHVEPGPGGGGTTSGMTVHGDIIVVTNDPDEIGRRIERGQYQKAQRGGVFSPQLAFNRV